MVSWDLAGNAGTDQHVAFLGTKDNQPLVIKTNADANPNVERLRVDASGNIGVGIASPLDIFHVFTSSGEARARFEANNGTGAFRAYSFGTRTSDFNLHIRDESGNRDIFTADWASGHVGIGAAPGTEMLTIDGYVRASGVKFPDGSVQETVAAKKKFVAICGEFVCDQACAPHPVAARSLGTPC